MDEYIANTILETCFYEDKRINCSYMWNKSLLKTWKEGETMLQRKIELTLSVLGLVGMVLTALISIIDSQATDLLSVIPMQILFASLFIVGYISAKFKNK